MIVKTSMFCAAAFATVFVVSAEQLIKNHDFEGGIKDGKAKSYLKETEKRRRMNDALFQFINENEIDIVVCFGRLVMDHLPSLNPQYKKEEDGGKLKDGKIFVGGKRDYIGKCTYLPDIEHKKSLYR
jgi:hypothetical protein